MRNILDRASRTLLLCCFSLLLVSGVSAEEISQPQVASADKNSNLTISSKTEITSARTLTVAKNLIPEKLINKGNIDDANKVKTSTVADAARDKKIFKSRPKARDEGNCFVNCLAESVPLEAVLECAASCAMKNWPQCATCLGVGVTVVITCAVTCYLID